MRNHQSKKTGPNTPGGKSRSSQNSTTHGLRSSPRKLLPGETQAELDAIRASWEAEFESDSPAIQSLLTPLIEADRMMRLATTNLFEAEIALCESGLTEEQLAARHKRYQLVLRYKTTHERAFRSALRTIEQFVGRRSREDRAEYRLAIHKKLSALRCVAIMLKHNISPAPDPTTEPEPAAGFSSSEEHGPVPKPSFLE